MLSAATAPWTSPLTEGQHSLVYYVLVVAGLALLASSVKTWVSISEIGPRYRPAVYASLSITVVAFLSYVVLVAKFDLGYDPTSVGWIPNDDAILSWIPRYMDWSVTVPLLMVELIAVGALAGTRARRVRAVGMAAAFAMIFTGFLGGVVIDDGENLGALWLWGSISGLFMVLLYVIIVYLLVATRRALSSEIGASYRNVCILLLVVWFASPVVFGLQGMEGSGTLTTVMQVVLCAADVTAKIGFGVLIHKVAKLRTAEDVTQGQNEHPESVWVSSVKHADAVLPPANTSSSPIEEPSLLATDAAPTSNPTARHRPGASDAR